MKKIKLLITAASIMLFLIPPLWAGNVRITQIDTNSLLFKGRIDIYFSIPGSDPDEIQLQDFTVKEKNSGQLSILSLDSRPNIDAGIDFILLIDNSGSMYDESYQGSSRINQAKLALSSFLDRIENSKHGKETRDRAAVYAFNTRLNEIAPLGTPFADIRRGMSMIQRPEADMAYTELYNSLVETGRSFQKTTGRRAVIVLSDGENYPIVEHGTSANPAWGTYTATPDDVINTAHEAGMTIDGINISDSMDTGLSAICRDSGGEFYDVRSTAEISGVYNSIRERIGNEYRLTVTAPPLGEGSGEIIIEYNGNSDSRPLHIPLLFGSASQLPAVIRLLLLIAGLAGIAVLYIIPFDRPVKSAQLQGLDSHLKTILNEGATIIGSSREADCTIAGTPGIDAQHATIIHDEKTGEYTLVSEKTVRVNNCKVKNKKLTAGDVIRIESSTLIFDAPENTEAK